MAKVIQIPTPHNMLHQKPTTITVKTASYDDGTVMIEMGDMELWLEMEQAVELLEHLSEAVADSWELLRQKTRELIGE